MEEGLGEENICSILTSFSDKMKNMEGQDGNTNSDEFSQASEGWEDPGVKAMQTPDMAVSTPSSLQPKTFATIVTEEQKTPKINFRTLFNEERVEDTDFVLPVENVERAYNKFANSLVGFFVGKKVAFPLVKNYVTNTWSKFGFQQIMSDDDGVFYFKFTSTTGLEKVLEQGPWMIRNQPLILTKWAPNLTISKDRVSKVPVWVKIHKVPVVAYSEDGLSLIASQIGKPIMLDAFTSAMCTEPWGRIGYARALIEISAEKDVKKEVKMAVPILNGEGHTKVKMAVEYEWQPPRCMECQLFGHDSKECPKRVVDPVMEKKDIQDDGFTTVRNRRSKGKKSDVERPRNIEGIKLNKPKPNFMWSVKSNQNVTKPTNTSTDDINIITLKNNFNALQDQDDVFIVNDVGASSSGNKVTTEHVKVDQVAHDCDSDSEVEEVANEFELKDDIFKGASTPSNVVVNENQLSVCAILESHVDIHTLSSVCSKVFRTWEWTTNMRFCSKGCRIILGWNKDVVDVLVVAQSSQAIHAKIIHKADQKVLFCTFIYAGNKPMERRILWTELALHRNVVRGVPWVLMSDFNVALNMEDKHAGYSSMDSAMCDFKDCVKDIEVFDVNSFGLHYTWNQKPKGMGGILKKLDRIMCNTDFVDVFPGAHAIFQPYRISDHSPSVLKIPTLSAAKPKPFKFFNFLAHKENFVEMVSTNWNMNVEGHAMYQVVQKMKALKKSCRKLLHDQGNLHDRVNQLRTELDEVQKALDLDPSNSMLRDEEAVYVQAFNNAKIDEERFLKQKAKIEWLAVGDSNSAYFHKSIKSRMQRSRINVITTLENVEVIGDAVPNVFVSHYEAFLGTDMVCDVLDSEGLFNNKVSDSSNEKMTRPVTDEEIKRAMFDIGNDKSPGLDGFTSVFFKRSWNVVGQDVCNAIRELFRNGKRGLRQGDPLSPYLFTLVMEVLTLILQRRVRVSDSFRYHKHCEELKIINVCFADDLFLFARGDVNSAKVILDSLNEFKHVSGLVPSIPKSTAFFCNVLNHVKLGILNIMPFLEGELPVKYLGVPLISSRLLNKDCKILVEKAQNRIGDWKNKSLSFAGRLQLCTSVLSSMQVYWASVLAIPKGIISDIQQITRGFLWCNGDYKRGKAKVSWESICLPKREGGLGLRSLEIFNRALMTTHIWNILTNKESLWVRWIHMYKLRGRSLWEVQPKSTMSWGWRKILELREHVRPFIWAAMGNGQKTSLWYDQWCLQSPLIWYFSLRDIPRAGHNLQTCVADLLIHGVWNWPTTWITKAPILESIPALNLDSTRHDFMQWCEANGNKTGFSVWKHVRTYDGIEKVNPMLNDILLWCQSLTNQRSVRGVAGKLIFAAASYYIWMERNNRLFKNATRPPEEICELIIVTVRLKLLTFKFKNTTKVTKFLSLWKMPKKFRIYG
ncbi:RNA-directed DNA polymerase, eukaryota, reverse transcriptase zinc-binding domain protein [Tanacetum coccineum]